MKKNKKNVPHGTFSGKIFILLGILLFSIVSPFKAYTYPLLYGEENLLMDADSGIIYIADNIDEQRGIASLTKLMSMYVVYDEIAKQNIKQTQEVTISEKVANLHNVNPSISGVYYNTGQQETVADLIDLSLVYSDNGAIIALSEYVSGSEAKHVDKMNAKAKELGMDNTIFYNVSGLTMEDYGEYKIKGTTANDYNKSSARDMGILAYNLIKDYPQILDITSKTSITYQGYEYYTYNQLLPGMSYETEGVQGLKTGTTNEAGECLMTYYETKDRNYITVSLDVPNIDYSYNRYIETQTMYEWIDEQLLATLVNKEENVTSINLKGDTVGSIKLYPKTNIEILKTENISFSLVSETYNTSYFNKDNLLIKDIPQGEVVKTLCFTVPELTEEQQESGEIPAVQSVYGDENKVYIDLIAKQDIKVANAGQKILLSISYFIEELFN
ncbi:MAG: D-alanyl-D-alanine carboxypeptidase family protein [Mycoplasmatales bacterium]